MLGSPHSIYFVGGVMIKKLTFVCAAVALAACEMDSASVEGFEIRSVGIAPLATKNLCTAIGGEAVQPQLTVMHSPVPDVRMTVRMYDVHNDGTVTEHNTVRVTTDADGSTLVNSGFLPPCNRTEGRRNSSYRFDIFAGGQTTTLTWGDFNSSTMQIQ